MQYPSFIQKLFAAIRSKFSRNKVRVQRTTCIGVQDTSKHHRGCFVKVGTMHTRYFATHREAAEYLAKVYRIAVPVHKVSNALRERREVKAKRYGEVLAKVSYYNDID